MAAKITTDGLWRVSYGEIPGLTPEEVPFHPAVRLDVNTFTDGRKTAYEIRTDAPRKPQTRPIQTGELQSLQNAPTLR